MNDRQIVRDDQLEQHRVRRRDRGETVVALAELGDEPWDLAPTSVTVTGHVADREDATRVVLAAARGAGVLVSVSASMAEVLAHDLARLGGVRTTPGDIQVVDDLSEDARCVLTALGDGCSMAEAAERCFVSERTAFRRVTAARRSLGVASTAEAVLAVVRSR